MAEEELYYSPLDLAAIISSLDLEAQKTADFLDFVWENERPYLKVPWRQSKRDLVLHTLYWLTYLQDGPVIDEELPLIQKDVAALGRDVEYGCSYDGSEGLNLFFKSARLRMRYGEADHVRIKRRTLLSRYGYRRMSAALLQHLNACLKFYGLNAYLRGGVPCRLQDTSIDDMIVLRIASDGVK